MEISIGSSVIFVDAVGHERPALVTSIFSRGEKEEVGVNVVFVSNDATMTDQYGRQIGRATSVVHKSAQPAPGMYWKRADE